MTDTEFGVPASYPLRTPRIWTRLELWCALALSLPVFALYLMTLGGGVGWWDSGELMACAKTLSVAHRPGFPLYIILGRITFGFASDPRFLANAESALAAALALAFLWRGLCLLSGASGLSKAWIAAGGLFLATSPLWWRQAIRTEVYAPTYACLGAAFLLAAASQRAPDPRTAVRRFLLCIYLAALSCCLHYAVSLPVCIAMAALFLWGDFRPSLSQWGWATLTFVLGLTVFAYVPLRAPWASYVWGEPGTLRGFLAYLSASDSYPVISQEAGGTLLRAGQLANVLVAGSHGLFVAVGLCGMAHGALLGRRFGRQPLLLFAAGLGVAATVVSFVIEDNADLQAYLVPMLFALWWGWSRLDPVSLLHDISLQKATWLYAVLLLLLLPVLTWSARSGREEVKAAGLGLSDRWGQALLSGTRTGDLVVIQDANTEFLLRGLAHSEAGPKVTLLNASLAESPWYRAWWQHQNGEEAGNAQEIWIKQVAENWRRAGGRVLVDFGTPGFLPSELQPAEWLGLWSPSDTTAAWTDDVPVLHAEGGESDPDWVRTAVWYYYRLGSYYRLRGHNALAAKAWDLGLEWAPGEKDLLSARAELAQSGKTMQSSVAEESHVAVP